MYSSIIIGLNKSRRMREAVHVACMETTTSSYRVSVGRSEGKKPLGRPRLKRDDNIKLIYKKWGGET